MAHKIYLLLVLALVVFSRHPLSVIHPSNYYSSVRGLCGIASLFFGVLRMLRYRVVYIQGLGEFYCANPNNSMGAGGWDGLVNCSSSGMSLLEPCRVHRNYTKRTSRVTLEWVFRLLFRANGSKYSPHH